MNKLINKYGIIISIIYLVDFLLSYLGIIASPFNLIYYFSTNIMVAIIVAVDLNKNEMKSSIVIWSTILFPILGVTLLLLKKINKDKTASS